MAREVIGSVESLGEVIVKDTETGEITREPGTPEQITEATETAEAAWRGEDVTYEEYVEPGSGLASVVLPIAAGAITTATLPAWLAGVSAAALGVVGAAAVAIPAAGWAAKELVTYYAAQREYERAKAEHAALVAELRAGASAEREQAIRIEESRAAQQTAVAEMNRTIAEHNVLAYNAIATAATTARSREELDSLLRTGTVGLVANPDLVREMKAEAVRYWDEAQTKTAEETLVQETEAVAIVDLAGTYAGAPPIDISGPAAAGALSAAGLAALVPTIANTMARSSHKQGISCMATTGATMLSGITQAAMPAALAAGFMLSPQLQAGLQGIAAKALDMLYKPLEGMAPITPDKAPGVATNLLLQAVLMGSGAHLMSVTAEAAAPLKHMGLGYLSAFMADMAGFSRIAAAFQGTFIQWGLTQPMRYWGLDKFRPMMLSERDFAELMSRRAFTDPEVLRTEGLEEGVRTLPGGGGLGTERAIMGYLGYPDGYLPLFKELANARLGYFPLAGIARSGFYEREWFSEALARTGYSVTAKEQLLGMYEDLVLESTKGMMSGAVTKPYRLGLLWDDEFHGHLGSLGYQVGQREKALYAAQLDFATEQAEDWKDLYIDRYVKGLLDEDDLGLAITGLGYRPEKVELEVARAITMVTPKVAREEPVQVKAITRDTQKKLVSAYTYQFRKDYISAGQFYDSLLQVKIEPGLARATVILEESRKLPKLKEITP